MSTAEAAQLEIKRALHTDLQTIDSEEGFISRYGEPIAGISLPKQRALKRIIRQVLGESGFIFWNRTARLDQTFAVKASTNEVVRVTVDHTLDAIDMINHGGGTIKIHSASDRTVPVMAIVGSDGFAAARIKAEENYNPWFTSVMRPMQTTTAGLVFAAERAESLEQIGDQHKISVASTYTAIYRRFLSNVFGNKADSITLIERKGGVESTKDYLPGISVIGDLTDSGGSLAENGLNHVLPVDEAAPIIVAHRDWREHVEPGQIDKFERLALRLQEASQRAFPNQRMFDLRTLSTGVVDTLNITPKNIREHVMTLDTYLKNKGKEGVRPEGCDTVDFYGIPSPTQI